MPVHLVRCEKGGRSSWLPAAAAGFPRCGPCPKPLPRVIDADDDSFVAIAGCATSPYSRYMVAVVRALPPGGPGTGSAARDLAGQVKLVNVNVQRRPGCRPASPWRPCPA